ncbi:MAG: tRNA (adenosine(37)-N6)-threonylcarbamoyltransferase complex transferase subunit TsaD [Clostridia bacterium]|nr:tRNA (adenosine(37)-N6)-threonylcarbamoyltransferase complex transferase subunit TsaD [Clostridia bacterium]
MTYLELSKEKLNELRNRNDYLILAFESSCDETAVAVTRGREVLSSVISSQIEIHKRFGGVVPEIASRNHALAIDNITKEALEKAGVTLQDIDVIAVTYGAGLLGALLVGVSYAKSLAYTLKKPLVACNHIKGHIAANYISTPDLEPPFICLLASGGHTYILKVNAFDDMEVMGETQDDAVGEAFDKVARVLGLPYPGGPEIDRLARTGSPVYKLPRAFKGETHLNFSYSGLKTAVINLVANTKARGGEINPADLACSFQTEATGVLIDHTIEATKRTGIKTICLAGGVGANSALRDGLTKAGQKNGCKVLLPPKYLCTDNGAMIGICAYEEIKCGIEPADLSLDANPAL